VTVMPLNSPPTICLIPYKTVAEYEAAGPVACVVGDTDTPLSNLILSATSSNPALAPVANIVFGGSGSNRTVTVTPAFNQSGTATITVTVSDGQASASTSLLLTVVAGNHPPAISRTLDQTVNEDSPGGVGIAFAISDVETSASNLMVTATSSNPALVPPANVLLSGNGANRTVTLIPLTNQFGATVVTLTVSDGSATVTNRFTLNVAPVNDPPTLSALSDLTIAQNAGPHTVSLAGISTGAPNELDSLTITATSSNPSLIPTPTINYTNGNGTGRLVFTPAQRMAGTAIIAVTVND